ncbi:MAG: plasmid pRiA4b ORF-3 family protein [Anaerolineales bacterium]
MAEKRNQIYQIKVTLHGTHPPIWRSILVPGNTTLLKLHDILQIVMGWENAHLHMFKLAGLIYDDPMNDVYGDMSAADEANCKLSQLIHSAGQRFSYEYDFGDSWEHRLVVEKILSGQERLRYPICLKGKRACPPEDVGGVWGYDNFLKAIQDPEHEEHEDYLSWIGGEFDPEAFDLDEVNDRLQRMVRGSSTEYLDPWSVHNSELAGKEFDLDPSWSNSLPKDQLRVVDELALRHDVIALLTYLRDNKVTGTQSTGNLPLKAVNEICARFVNPPVLEINLGEHIYRARSETDIWPLHFRHILVSVGRLATGGRGRRWKLTPRGERFLTETAILQVWILATTWWMKVNWAVAFPYNVDEETLSGEFLSLTLEQLLDLPAGTPVAFERFADQLVKKADMEWDSPNKDNAQHVLHSVIERTLINPLADFGVLKKEYVPHELLGEEFQRLSSFQITPFGKGLLEAINATMET